MQAHIQRQQADQLRAHYARVYNARPSPEILKVSAGRTSSRNNSRPGQFFCVFLGAIFCRRFTKEINFA